MMYTTQNKEIRIYTLLRKFALLPLLFLFVACSSTKVSNSPDLLSIRENNSTVSEFVKYVNENNHLTPDHTYIKNALNKLADATNAMAGEVGYTVNGNLADARAYANNLTVNSNESTHADGIRKAADILTAELESLQMQKYPKLKTEVADLKTAASAINPAVLAGNQKQEIVTYLSRSASLLDKMN